MATVAVDAVVDIVAHTIMFIVHLRLQMAAGTCEYLVITRVVVACGADTVGLAVRHGEPSVVECGPGPINDGWEMTAEAGLGEPGGKVIGICSGAVFGRVTRVAVGGRTRELASHMAR